MSMTQKFVYEKSDLKDFNPDQTCIIKKDQLSLLYPSTDVEDLPKVNEWYPFCNSYYPFTEDADAFARVNHLLVNPPQEHYMPPPETGDFYSEYDIQHQYLTKKPLNFLILGKPNIGQEDIGKQLADNWKCVHINPQILINQEILSKSRSGECIEFNLRYGRAIGNETLLRLLEEKVKEPSCQHRGFVISGFPLIPNDLKEDELVSTESAIFNAKEIFNEIIDSTVGNFSKQNVSVKSEESIDAHSIIEGIMETPEKEETTEEERPDLVEYKKQINFIFDLFQEPFIIVYIVCENIEVIYKRRQIFYDVERGLILDYPVIAYNGDLVRLPQNFEAHVATQLDRYHQIAFTLIERKILTHNYQYLIKIDGRAYSLQMFNIIKAKLSVLPIQRVIVPEPFVGELTGETKFNENLSLEEYIKRFSREKTAARKFKYSLSSWGTKCPVDMKNNKVTDGLAKFAVHFLNKMYFLSSEESMKSFIESPRQYMDETSIVPFNRCFIFGPPHCGKTNLAKCLNFLLNGTVVEYEAIRNKYKKEFANAKVDDSIKQNALEQGLNKMKEKEEQEVAEKNAKRLEKIDKWVKECRGIIKNMVSFFDKTKPISDVSSFPQRLVKSKSNEVVSDAISHHNQLLRDHNVPPIYDKEQAESLLQNNDLLLDYIPSDLKHPIQPRFIDINDDSVVNYAEEMIRDSLLDVPLTEEDENKIFNEMLSSMQDSSKCIIVDIPLKSEFLNQIPPELIPDNVVLLEDPSMDFLLERFKNKVREDVKLKEIFTKLGRTLIAQGIEEETASFKERFVRDILDQIIGKESQVSEEAVEEYKESLNEFNENINIVKDFCTKTNTNLIEVNVTDNSLNDVLSEVVSKLTDKYGNVAVPYTDEDRAEEVKDFLDSLKEIGIEDKKDDDLFFKSRAYGDTFIYCPVSLHEKFVLWQGKDNYTAKLRDKIYLLSTQEAFDKFLNFPSKFLFTQGPPNKIPPLRICVIGVEGSGKTVTSKILSENLGVQYVSFNQFFEKNKSPDNNEEDVDSQNLDNKNEDILDKFIDFVWFKEPTKSIGFVVDDFPKNLFQLEYMIKRTAIPDCIVFINVDREIIIARLLTKYLEKWQIDSQAEYTKRQNEHLDKLQQIMMARGEKFRELMAIKREERYLQIRQGSLQYFADEFEEKEILEEEEGLGEEVDKVSIDSVAEREDIDEINKILDKEFPEPSLEPPESEKDASDRILAEVQSKIEKNIGVFDQFRETCKAEIIPWNEINGNINEVKTKYNALFVTKTIKNRNQSFLETVNEITLDVAEKLLNFGYYFLSKFGKTCPVQFYEADNPFQMYLNNLDLHVVIHRSYIYYISSEKNLNKFKDNPLKYIGRNDFNFPLIPFRVAIIGPPKCGKTCLADRYRRDLGLKLISRDEAALYVLGNLQSSNLAQQVQQLLDMGWELTDELVMKCVEAASFDPMAATQGIVFDGFPSSLQELKLFTKIGLVPYLVFDFNADIDQIYSKTPIINIEEEDIICEPLVMHWFILWLETKDDFRNYLNREYQNKYPLEIEKCLWGIWCDSLKVTKDTFYEIKHYLTHINLGWPVRLTNMLVTPLEFLERQSQYRSYCPGCLFEKKLRNGGSPPKRVGLVQYLKFFYWLCPVHIEDFLRYPEQYLRTDSLPADLPQIITEINPDLEIENICLVCYWNSIPRKEFFKGSIELGVLYKNKIYLFDSKKCQSEFLCDPNKYANVVIHFKEKRLTAPLNYVELPTLGFLEQYVALQVAQAVNNCNVNRPLIPGLSIALSAAINIGLHLKLHNPKTSKMILPSIEAAYKKFNERKNNLKIYLKEMKSRINPYMDYEKPLSDSMLSIVDEILDNIEYRGVKTYAEQGSLPTESSYARRVPVPDERFDYLCEYFKPVSKVPAFLNVVDIAGLVKGASEGQGLGNAFLSHISACDAIFHLCRAFEDDDVTHVEGDVNPVRDLDIISEELRLKDEETLMKNLEKLERTVVRGSDKKLKPEYDTLMKIKGVLVDQRKHIRFHDWDAKDIEVLNKYLFLTSKPALYLVNLSEKDYIKKKNKWLIKIKEWVDQNDPGSVIIPFSGAFEQKLLDDYQEPALRKKFLEDNNTSSALDKIIVQGYKTLQLEYFFTAGTDEVKAWTIQKGTKAPQAAGKIHTDFEKGFIMAEVMKFEDFKEEGSEAACKAAGKYRQQGRNYTVEDGDIIFFKFNAGAGLKDAKKK